MAKTLVISTSPVGNANRAAQKARKLFRGIKRTLIRKTIAKLKAIKYSDERDFNRGSLLGYEAAQAAGYGTDANSKAFTLVLRRLEACMAMMEGER